MSSYLLEADISTVPGTILILSLFPEHLMSCQCDKLAYLLWTDKTFGFKYSGAALSHLQWPPNYSHDFQTFEKRPLGNEIIDNCNYVFPANSWKCGDREEGWSNFLKLPRSRKQFSKLKMIFLSLSESCQKILTVFECWLCPVRTG